MNNLRRASAVHRHDRPPAFEFPFVHERFSALAYRYPDRIAIVCGDVCLSYGGLDSGSNRLARRLIGLGAGREDKVALCFGRTASAFVAMLAVLKAGAAYVPLDPDAPAERLEAMLADAGCGFLLSDAAHEGRVPPRSGLARLVVQEAGQEAGQEADQAAEGAEGPEAASNACLEAAPPAVDIHPDQLAYVVFTSGSTGRPKGVAVAHGPLAMHADAVGALYGAGPEDVVLHVIALTFDGATECWLAALAHGGRLVVGDARSWTAADALAAIRGQGATIVGMSPALLSSLVEAHEEEGGGPLPVRSWTAGGEAFPMAAFLRARESFRPARIINGYGPTEAVITPLLFSATPETPASAFAEAAFVPIGTAVGARRAHVLDLDLNEAGIGIAGELYIGGFGLARGYVGGPGATAARFLPDPFGPPGGRLYRTGDRVRRRADGGLDYLGRIDAQMKIRGFRIEPGEIEAHLLSDPDCREAAAASVMRDGEAHLVAYVSGKARPEALAARLRARLPEHMRPSLIVALPALPRLANGKIDRLNLPAPEWRARRYEEPRSATERALAALWSEILREDRIGRADNFFERGGHSLSAAKLVAKIRTNLNANLTLEDFYAAPNLAGLAALIDQGAKAHDALAALDALLAQWEA
jgi:amino acid adenylation domain-containing protein